ncbi:MAG: energy transducer TonB [Burkholderiales bacterium]
MDYARHQRDPARHAIGITFVVLIHVLVIWALFSGLGKNVIQILKKPLNATIIEEVKLPPPPPPPPPPKKIIEPPKTPPPPQETYVPPPDIPPPVTSSAPTITAVTPTVPTEQHVIAPPPPVVAPPAPPKPAIRRGITRIAGDDPTYPREAIRAGVAKGRVTARLQIDEKGNVTEVIIVSQDPPRVFEKAVRNALEGWKFKAEGEKYVGEVEINFTLKDE